MKKGYYKSRFDRTGKQLEIRYFEPEVLNKYKNSSYYILSDTRISTKFDAPSEIRRVSLQQYMWGRKRNGSPCIAVLLSHICRLDSQEQMYWRSFELPKKEAKQARIEARHSKPMVQGKFPDVLPSFEVIIPILNFINQITFPGTLFRKVPAGKPSFLQPIINNSKREYMYYIQELDKLISTNIGVSYLLGKISSPEKNNFKKRGETLNLLGLYLEELGGDKSEIKACLDSLKTVRKEREVSAHKLFEDDFTCDYVMKQKQITLEVWKSLYQIAQWLKSALDVNNSVKRPRFSDLIII